MSFLGNGSIHHRDNNLVFTPKLVPFTTYINFPLTANTLDSIAPPAIANLSLFGGSTSSFSVDGITLTKSITTDGATLSAPNSGIQAANVKFNYNQPAYAAKTVEIGVFVRINSFAGGALGDFNKIIYNTDAGSEIGFGARVGGTVNLWVLLAGIYGVSFDSNIDLNIGTFYNLRWRVTSAGNVSMFVDNTLVHSFVDPAFLGVLFTNTIGLGNSGSASFVTSLTLRQWYLRVN